MGRVGFLSRVARYGHASAAEQRENRLTEIVAALFESSQCDGLSRAVARGWMGAALRDSQLSHAEALASRRSFQAAQLALANDAATWACEVQTQVPVYGHRTGYVDLELRFYSTVAQEDDVRLWVEIKNGIEPHDHQLRLYADEWTKLAVAGGVLLVAPRADYEPFDSDQLDVRVPRLSWQQTAELFRAYEGANDVSRFLLAELCEFLIEEGLMDQELTPIHHVALAHYRDAVSSLLAACDIASRWVREHWDAPGEQVNWRAGSRIPDDRWETHSPWPEGGQDVDWGLWSCGWNLYGDSARLLPDGRRGVPCFIAGLRKEAEGIDDSEWAQRLRDANFEIWPRWGHQVRRVAYPEEVVVGRGIEAQGESLGRWIVDAFQRLFEIGPPRRTP